VSFVFSVSRSPSAERVASLKAETDQSVGFIMRHDKGETGSAEAGDHPPDYLENIIQMYHGNQQSLQALAEGRPRLGGNLLSSHDLEERRLLENQDHLLELATLVKPSSLKQVHQILTLWHQLAVREVAPHDVSIADKLVLAAFQYAETAIKHN